ncbi:hypothetical protein SSS_03424 [Sarcoptes scabiei]|uniref:Uncharacterized protein n=1 Tax=Sarcoptes scabiei TaxID=52283 RepID=A0A834R5Z1_SARSC|nr:hypothetical protein SSS_03424 [Sarcoptes scabiei]
MANNTIAPIIYVPSSPITTKITPTTQPAVRNIVLYNQRIHRRKLRRKQERFFYKIACLIYAILVIILVMFWIARAFRYKYYAESERFRTISTDKDDDDDVRCPQSNHWIDSTISIITLIIVILASGIIVASTKYVLGKLVPLNEIPMITPVEDFIRRNSEMPSESNLTVTEQKPIQPVRPNPWLTDVRNEAYDLFRRKSSAFAPNRIHPDWLKSSNPSTMQD